MPQSRRISCLSLVLIASLWAGQLVDEAVGEERVQIPVGWPPKRNRDTRSFVEKHMEFGRQNHQNSEYRMGANSGLNAENVYQKPARPGVTVYTSQQQVRPQQQQWQQPQQPQQQQQSHGYGYVSQQQPPAKSYDLVALKNAEEALQVMIKDAKYDEMLVTSAKLIDQLGAIVSNEQVGDQDRRDAAIIMAYAYYSRAVGLCKKSGNDIDRIILARDEAERARIICDKVGVTEYYCSTGTEKENIATPLIKEINQSLLTNIKSKKDIFLLLRKVHPDKNRLTSPEVKEWRDELTKILNEMKNPSSE